MILNLDFLVAEGGQLKAETKCLTLNGNARSILSLERTMLNFLQRMCGVATKTSKYVKIAPSLKIFDTRKTLPGWRSLDKYAVKVGGGNNHRMNLSDLILIKDNHIEANAGSIEDTLSRVFRDKPKEIPVLLEVDTIEQLKIALKLSS